MRKFPLVSLFAILLSDIMLGLGLTLAPGLSLKNAMLYILFVALVLEFAVGHRDPLHETWPLHIHWFLLVTYATFTWLVIVLLGIHRGYDGLQGFIDDPDYAAFAAARQSGSDSQFYAIDSTDVAGTIPYLQAGG